MIILHVRPKLKVIAYLPAGSAIGILKNDQSQDPPQKAPCTLYIQPILVSRATVLSQAFRERHRGYENAFCVMTWERLHASCTWSLGFMCLYGVRRKGKSLGVVNPKLKS